MTPQSLALLLGAGGGYLLADDEHKLQGTLLGAGGGLALGHVFHSPKVAPHVDTTPSPGVPVIPSIPSGDANKIGAQKAAAMYNLKLADVSIGIGVPGTPLSFGTRGDAQRLPGMSRWVPTGTLERAFTGLDAEADPDALARQEGRRGLLTHPAAGAAAAAALAHFGVPVLGGMRKSRAAALGAASGLLYNRISASDREKDMREALKGVQRERSNSAITGQHKNTANESRPLIMSRGDA